MEVLGRRVVHREEERDRGLRAVVVLFTGKFLAEVAAEAVPPCLRWRRPGVHPSMEAAEVLESAPERLNRGRQFLEEMVGTRTPREPPQVVVVAPWPLGPAGASASLLSRSNIDD